MTDEQALAFSRNWMSTARGQNGMNLRDRIRAQLGAGVAPADMRYQWGQERGRTVPYFTRIVEAIVAEWEREKPPG